MSAKAEIMINGPKGQSFATIEVEENGSIHPAMAEQALAAALNYYNELSEPYRAIAFGKDDFVVKE